MLSLTLSRRNSFYVASCHATKPPVACALYVNPSFFNHSCSPNVTYQTTPEMHRPRVFVYIADADMPKDAELYASLALTATICSTHL